MVDYGLPSPVAMEYARDRGAYMASAINDGPFFSMLFLGAAGLADIPYTLLLVAVISLIIGIIVGNLDAKWTEIMRPIPNMVIPFFAFALGTGIDLGNVVTGGLSGLVGAIATVITVSFAHSSGYRWILCRGSQSGIGIASATTAGNAIATPAIIAGADLAFEPYMEVAIVEVASAVFVQQSWLHCWSWVFLSARRNSRNKTERSRGHVTQV